MTNLTPIGIGPRQAGAPRLTTGVAASDRREGGAAGAGDSGFGGPAPPLGRPWARSAAALFLTQALAQDGQGATPDARLALAAYGAAEKIARSPRPKPEPAVILPPPFAGRAVDLVI